MYHPFALNLTDLESLNLDFVEEITDEEAARVNGGGKETDCYVTGTLGTGVRCSNPKSLVKPTEDKSLKKPKTTEKAPPEATTQAVGEEGGDTTFTTLAVGEEGGGEVPVK